MNCVPGAFILGMLRRVGATLKVIAYTDPVDTSASVMLTANTETTYDMDFVWTVAPSGSSRLLA